MLKGQWETAQSDSGSEILNCGLFQLEDHGVAPTMAECHITSFWLAVGCYHQPHGIMCVRPYVEESGRILGRLLRYETLGVARAAIFQPVQCSSPGFLRTR